MSRLQLPNESRNTDASIFSESAAHRGDGPLHVNQGNLRTDAVILTNQSPLGIVCHA